MSCLAQVFLFAIGIALSCNLALSSGTPVTTPAPISTDPCLVAFNRCDFTFSGHGGGVPVFNLGVQDNVAFTTQVISKIPGQFLGVLNSNGITPEFILATGDPVPITNFGNPHFTPTHFKPFSIPHTLGSGIGHQTFEGDQAIVARGKCIRIFFTEFQLLASPHGPVIDNRNGVPKDADKCVVFRTL